MVKIMPMTPDDPLPNLEDWLAALRASGPMEFDPGEQESIARALAEQDRLRGTALNYSWVRFFACREDSRSTSC